MVPFLCNILYNDLHNIGTRELWGGEGRRDNIGTRENNNIGTETREPGSDCGGSQAGVR